MKCQITFAIIVALLTFQKSFSQDCYMKGKIIDYETNNAIIGAAIIPDSYQNGAPSVKNGNFEIKDNTNNLEILFVGYYPLKFINIPTKQKVIDFGEIRLVQDYREFNSGAGIPAIPLSEDLIEQDKKLRKDVLKKYRIKILGKKLKPYFEGKYLIFNLNKKGETNRQD